MMISREELKAKSIEATIWSHHRFGHPGDPSKFPPSTNLVAGPGFKEKEWPVYPTNSEASILDSDA